jgi:SPX domain protein involved in polyphosphate accumulation
MSQDVNGEGGYRYERKFLVPRSGWALAETALKRNPAFFSDLFYPRAINNIYLDTIDLRHYFMNVNGVFDRTKVRIRWYGDLFGPVAKPVLEYKIKEGLLGTKESYPLAPFIFDAGFDIDRLREVVANSDLPALVRRELELFEPSLLNRYQRKYFQSANRQFRATLDTGLEFFRLRPRHNTFRHHTAEREHHVLELKYSHQHAAGADAVASSLPFRLGKISKYVLGMDLLDAC